MLESGKNQGTKELEILCKSKVPAEIYTGKELVRGFFKKVSKEFLEISFLEKNVILELKKTNFLQVQFVFNNRRYQFLSHYKKTMSNGIVMDIPYPIENLNIRQYPRTKVDFSFRVYFSSQGETHLGFVKNISEGGFLFTSTQPLLLGGICPFAMSVPTSSEVEELCFSAKIVHSSTIDNRDRYIIGTEFTQPEKNVHENIKSFILALNSENNAHDSNKAKNLNIEGAESQSSTLLKKLLFYTSSWKKVVSKKKVLCIETKRAERNALKKILSGHYEVDFVNDIGETVSKIASFMPDIVISEINLDKMDFFMLYESIKENEHVKNTPFAIYTVNNNKTVIINALKEYNVREYITKPIISKEFIVRLDNVINSTYPTWS